jgi:uncharacterized membrane protein YvbJ
MYCKECGHQIADDSKFCSICGKLQGKEVVSNPENSNVDSLQLEDKIAEEETEKNIFGDIGQEEKSSFGWLFGILFVIIAVIVGTIALKGNYTPSEKQNINKGESSNKSFKVARIKYEVTGTAHSASITQTNLGLS